MDHTQHATNTHNTDRRQPQLDRLGRNVVHLRQIEGQMDALFGQLLATRGEHALSDAATRLDELVLAYPELRIPQVADHPHAALDLLAHLDLEHGPLPGFQPAMKRLCSLCLTSESRQTLRSLLYTIAARVSHEHPDLLPAAALAVLSLRPPNPTQTLLTEMVLCASAIEWGLAMPAQAAADISLDVSTWLIAEPSERLLAAVGKEQAHRYASIPGILPFLDPNRILFDVQRLAPPNSPSVGPGIRSLDDLADPGYTRQLRTEIERVQSNLRKQYPAPSIADIELLSHRALEALDDLPVQVNPLLQAIWIQSWVRHLSPSNWAEEAS